MEIIIIVLGLAVLMALVLAAWHQFNDRGPVVPGYLEHYMLTDEEENKTS